MIVLAIFLVLDFKDFLPEEGVLWELTDPQREYNKCPITLQTNLLIEKIHGKKENHKENTLEWVEGAAPLTNPLFSQKPVLIRWDWLEVSFQVPRIVPKCAKVSKFLCEKCRLQQHPSVRSLKKDNRREKPRKIHDFIDSKFRFNLSMRYSKISPLFSLFGERSQHKNGASRYNFRSPRETKSNLNGNFHVASIFREIDYYQITRYIIVENRADVAPLPNLTCASKGRDVSSAITKSTCEFLHNFPGLARDLHSDFASISIQPFESSFVLFSLRNDRILWRI